MNITVKFLSIILAFYFILHPIRLLKNFLMTSGGVLLGLYLVLKKMDNSKL
jgi:uncharacterized membrane protein